MLSFGLPETLLTKHELQLTWGRAPSARVPWKNTASGELQKFRHFIDLESTSELQLLSVAPGALWTCGISRRILNL